MHIRENQVWWRLTHKCPGLCGVVGADDMITAGLEGDLHEAEIYRRVIDDQNGRGCRIDRPRRRLYCEGRHGMVKTAVGRVQKSLDLCHERFRMNRFRVIALEVCR